MSGVNRIERFELSNKDSECLRKKLINSSISTFKQNKNPLSINIHFRTKCSN